MMYDTIMPQTIDSFTDTVATSLWEAVTVSLRYIGPHRRDKPSPMPYKSLPRQDDTSERERDHFFF